MFLRNVPKRLIRIKFNLGVSEKGLEEPWGPFLFEPHIIYGHYVYT